MDLDWDSSSKQIFRDISSVTQSHREGGEQLLVFTLVSLCGAHRATAPEEQNGVPSSGRAEVQNESHGGLLGTAPPVPDHRPYTAAHLGVPHARLPILGAGCGLRSLCPGKATGPPAKK